MIPAILAVVAAAAVIATARRRGWGWMAPMNVYAAVWCTAVVVHGLRLFPFHHLAASTWTVIALGAAAFISAAFAGGRVAGASPGAPGPAPAVAPLVLVMRTYFAVGLIGASWFLWQVHRTFGLAALAARPIDIHSALSDRTLGSSHLFLYYLGLAATVLFGYLSLTRRRRPTALDLLLLVLFVAAMAVSTERNHLLWGLACWLFLVTAPPAGDAHLGRLAAAAVAIGVLGVGFYVGAGEWLGKSAGNISGALIIEAAPYDPTSPPGAATRLSTPGAAPDINRDVDPRSRLRWILPGGPMHPFAVLYMSVAAALPSLDQGLRQHDRSYGQLTFRPLFRTLSRLGLVQETLRLTSYEDVRTPYPANAYTYLYEHVRDFGVSGAVIFPALFGLLAGWLYATVTHARAGFSAVWLALIQGMVLWSPFQNRFVLTVSAYLVAALAVAAVVSRSGVWYRRSISATTRSAP
jgi:hypothetical protein